MRSACGLSFARSPPKNCQPECLTLPLSRVQCVTLSHSQAKERTPHLSTTDLDIVPSNRAARSKRPPSSRERATAGAPSPTSPVDLSSSSRVGRVKTSVAGNQLHASQLPLNGSALGKATAASSSPGASPQKSPTRASPSKDKDTELKALRRALKSQEEDIHCAVQKALARAEKEQREVIKQAVAEAVSKANLKHTVELVSIKADVDKRVEAARKDATKGIEARHLKALAAEVVLREAAEAELADLNASTSDVSAARESELVAKQEAAQARDARVKMEGLLNQQLLRAKEFMSSIDERVEKVRHYADSLEEALAKTETEKDALHVRAKEITEAEVACTQLQATVDLAAQRHAAAESAEQAVAPLRAFQLEMLEANVETAHALAAAAAAEMAKNEALASIEGSRNDSALKKEADVKTSALVMDMETVEAEMASKQEVAATVAQAKLDVAEANVRAADAIATQAKLETVAFANLWASASAALRATTEAREYTAQLLAAEVEAKQIEIDARVRAAPAEPATKLATVEAEAAAAFECAGIEAVARASAAAAVADATLEAEKGSSAVREEALSAEAEANLEKAGGEAATALDAANAASEAKLEAETRKARAHEECTASVARADKHETSAMLEERDALEKVIAASKGWQRMAAENKLAEARRAMAQAKQEAEDMRSAASGKLEAALDQIAGQLQSKLSTIASNAEMMNGRTLGAFRGKATALAKKRENGLADIARRLSVAAIELPLKMEQTIADARARRDATTAEVRATQDAKINKAIDERDAILSATAAKLELARIAHTNSSSSSSIAEFAIAERRLKEAVVAAESKVKVARLPMETVTNDGQAAIAMAIKRLASAEQHATSTLQEVGVRSEDRRRVANEMRVAAAADADAVKLGVSDSAADNERAFQAASAACRVAEQRIERAKQAVVVERARLQKVRAEAATALEGELKASATARAAATAQLDDARSKVMAIKALEVAAKEAAAARKEVIRRKAVAEVDRRNAEDARTVVQHDSIKRRPGGRALFDSLELSDG